MNPDIYTQLQGYIQAGNSADALLLLSQEDISSNPDQAVNLLDDAAKRGLVGVVKTLLNTDAVSQDQNLTNIFESIITICLKKDLTLSNDDDYIQNITEIIGLFAQLNIIQTHASNIVKYRAFLASLKLFCEELSPLNPYSSELLTTQDINTFTILIELDAFKQIASTVVVNPNQNVSNLILNILDKMLSYDADELGGMLPILRYDNCLETLLLLPNVRDIADLNNHAALRMLVGPQFCLHAPNALLTLLSIETVANAVSLRLFLAYSRQMNESAFHLYCRHGNDLVVAKIMQLAKQEQNPNVLRGLVSKNNPIDPESSTPLEIAVEGLHLKTVSLLLEHPVIVDTANLSNHGVAEAWYQTEETEDTLITRFELLLILLARSNAFKAMSDAYADKITTHQCLLIRTIQNNIDKLPLYFLRYHKLQELCFDPEMPLSKGFLSPFIKLKNAKHPIVRLFKFLMKSCEPKLPFEIQEAIFNYYKNMSIDQASKVIESESLLNTYADDQPYLSLHEPASQISALEASYNRRIAKKRSAQSK